MPVNKRGAELSKKANIDENERDVDEVYKKLLDKHGRKWNIPRLRLWARCVCAQHRRTQDIWKGESIGYVHAKCVCKISTTPLISTIQQT